MPTHDADIATRKTTPMQIFSTLKALLAKAAKEQ
jgi:hypothetical protein